MPKYKVGDITVYLYEEINKLYKVNRIFEYKDFKKYELIALTKNKNNRYHKFQPDHKYYDNHSRLAEEIEILLYSNEQV